MLEIQEIFSPTSSVKSNNFADLLPASFRDDDLSIHTPLHDITKFLHLDLSVQRLNDIQEHLWLAGRPMPPRPLNYQISVSRQIIIDEKIDMHLIWGPGRRIHIKPLPQYLLDSQFWSTHLTCNDSTGASCCLDDSKSASTPATTTNINPCPSCRLSKYGIPILLRRANPTSQRFPNRTGTQPRPRPPNLAAVAGARAEYAEQRHHKPD